MELFQTFWKERMFIAKITGAFLVLGLLIALFSPKEYTAEATLIPESQSSSNMAGNLLQQYGGLLGIGGNASVGQKGGIPPQVYPNIVQSLPYQVDLIHTPIKFSKYDTTVTVETFFKEVYPPSLFSYMIEYSIGLPGKVFAIWDGGNDKSSSSDEKDKKSVLSLSRSQLELVGAMQKRITINIDQKTGLLTFSVEFPDPQAAAEIGQEGIKLLKERVKEHRTEKAKQNLDFVRSQLDSARIRFEEVQNKLADFRDSNLNLATSKAKTREQELQSQYDLAFNLYNSLSQRYEQAKLELQEETPVLSIIQPISVPLEQSAPKRALILIASVIFGLIVSIGWVFINDWWNNKLEQRKY